MSNTWSRGVVAALTVTFLSSLGHTAVLRVPGDYAAIQQAIDNSKNGDMILASPGVYKENINFKGKAITVASTNAADPEVVKSTIIHAAAKSSVVTFTTGETSNSILAGFTITGGYGNVRADLGTNIFWGAGVYCYFAFPTITGNIIAGNVSPNGDVSDMGYGGNGRGGEVAVNARDDVSGN